MKKQSFFLLIIALVPCTALFVLNSSCQSGNQPPGNLQIHTYPPQSDQPDNQITPNTAPTNDEQFVERNITVDDKNNIFSIGIPAGNKEITSISAAKPINYWFEYLTDNVTLEINGKEVQHDPTRWQTKLAFTESITSFNYKITNNTGSSISYNLHLVPSSKGDSIAVTVRQRWTK